MSVHVPRRPIEEAVVDEDLMGPARRPVHQHLQLTKVRCMVNTADDRTAGAVTVQLVLVNRSEVQVEYQLESVTIGIQSRIAEGPGVLRAPTGSKRAD